MFVLSEVGGWDFSLFFFFFFSSLTFRVVCDLFLTSVYNTTFVTFHTELSHAQSYFFQILYLSLLRTLRVVCRLLFLLLLTSV